jgi:hypothetical protein
MARVKRLLGAAAACAVAMAPITSSAAPTPSPSLDRVLAPPPSGYTEVTTSSLNGEFSAHEYAVNASGVSPDQTESTLKKEGFVDGYAKTWVSASPRRALVELVMAFTGGAGARNVLTALERSDKADPRFSRADTMSGIDPYYGVHFISGGTYADEFIFVKGNDLFGVAVGAPTDDALTPARDQTTTQYNSAPAETIPSSQWPENASHNLTFAFGALIPIVLVAVIVIGVGLILVARSRRPAAAIAGGMPPTVQMSPDGSYWWDGQAWRDASREAPPFAQRSSDGTLWWDGRTWRPVPPPAA